MSERNINFIICRDVRNKRVRYSNIIRASHVKRACIKIRARVSDKRLIVGIKPMLPLFVQSVIYITPEKEGRREIL